MASEGFSTRIAVVTGASAGIGEALARLLVQQGARVVLNARRAERLQDLCAELNGQRREAVAIAAPGDAADPAVVHAMLAGARAEFGAEADIVIVNAGRGLAGSVLTSDDKEWEDMIRTNLLAAARLARAAAESMLKSLEGQDWRSHPHDIVLLGSIVGRHVSPFSSMYGSTKFAVHGLAEGLRREVGPRGIRVTLVEPGFVTSEFQRVAGYQDDWYRGVVDRIGPVLQPDDVARAIAFALAQPPHVHVSDFIVRPTRQEYP
jgi:NADP-dependent 3-hydroxy acid dehydrogenase YdfG